MDQTPQPQPGDVIAPGTPPPAPLSPVKRALTWVGHNRIYAGIVTVLILAIPATLLLHNHFLPKPSPKPAAIKVVKHEPPKPVTKASPLTGAQVAPQLADRPITGVIIENQTDARPQSGLSEAGVVYEALAEGGITRFIAFYLDNRPKSLGPVRSLRTYFLSWGLEFNAPVAHAGGNADALDLVGPLGMKDMNEFSWGSSFYRTTDRYAPHNLYTTSDLLDALETKLGYGVPSNFTPSPRQADKPASPATASIIDLNYSYNGYQVEYQYDSPSNAYKRFLAGTPHIDRNTGAQIFVKNIVVEYMPTAYGTTRIGEQTVRMGASGMPIGSGHAQVFRDGTMIDGTWNKASNGARTILKDTAGTEIPLDIGNTWYSILPSTIAAIVH